MGLVNLILLLCAFGLATSSYQGKNVHQFGQSNLAKRVTSRNPAELEPAIQDYINNLLAERGCLCSPPNQTPSAPGNSFDGGKPHQNSNPNENPSQYPQQPNGYSPQAPHEQTPRPANPFEPFDQNSSPSENPRQYPQQPNGYSPQTPQQTPQHPPRDQRPPQTPGSPFDGGKPNPNSNENPGQYPQPNGYSPQTPREQTPPSRPGNPYESGNPHQNSNPNENPKQYPQQPNRYSPKTPQHTPQQPPREQRPPTGPENPFDAGKPYPNENPQQHPRPNSYGPQPHNNRPTNDSPNHQGGQPRRPEVDPSATIGKNAVVPSSSSVGKGSDIGEGSMIGENADIGDDVTIGKNVNVGNGAKIGPHCQILDNASVGDGCVMGENSSIGPNVEMLENSYVGSNCVLQPHCNIGDSAVIHDNVEIPSGETIPSNQVVMSAPSSYDMYSNCGPIGAISPSIIRMAADRRAKRQFNQMLLQAMDSQMDALNEKCEQTNSPKKLEAMPIIRTLFLIHIHGLDGFLENLRQVTAWIRIIPVYNVDSQCPPSEQLNALQNEAHFSQNAPKILDPHVEQKFGQLMALEQDEARENRTPNDNFCQMNSQIKSGERDVRFMDRRKNTNC